LGIFARKAVRDNQKDYLTFIPRVWKWIEKDLSHPALKDLDKWIKAHIYPFREEEKLELA